MPSFCSIFSTPASVMTTVRVFSSTVKSTSRISEGMTRLTW